MYMTDTILLCFQRTRLHLGIDLDPTSFLFTTIREGSLPSAF
jgi:hypothetical protein